jgi:hypothetical protein
MINNSKIRNCTAPFPAIQGLVNAESLGKIRLKNIYQEWNGESITEIRQKHENNPYTIRTGTPLVDEQLRNDRIYMVTHYMAFNPLAKTVEIRDLLSRRITDKLYVGQTTQESEYADYRLFVDGNIVADDVFLKKHDSIKNTPLGKLLVDLIAKVERQSAEIQQLKLKVSQQHIYTKQINQ